MEHLFAIKDGKISAAGVIMTSLMLIITSGLIATKWSMLTKITGLLWAGMGDHFVNNFIINVLHITSMSRADILQGDSYFYSSDVIILCGPFYLKKRCT